MGVDGLGYCFRLILCFVYCCWLFVFDMCLVVEVGVVEEGGVGL